MFASWKPVATSDGSNVLLCKRPHTFDPVTAKTERPVACSHCRAQKVRCTGDRGNGEGCRRCQSLGRKCTYYPPRRSSSSTTTTTAAPGEKVPGFTNATRPDPLDLPTPAPTDEGPARPVSSASASTTNRAAGAHEWIHESQGSYSSSSTTDFSNFSLDNDFTRYSSASALIGNCEGRFAPEQILGSTQENSLFRSSSQQHPEMYSGATGEQTANWSPRRAPTLSRLPQTGSSFSQTQTRGTERNTPLQSSVSDCQFLHHAVILMDELELLGEPATSVQHLPVDGILVAHRKALHQAEDMLKCVSCAARVENMMILTFLVSKLVDLSCRAISTLRCSTEASPHARNPLGANEALVTAIGAYRLESEIERIAVARVLLRLALDRLLGLVSTLQGVGRRLGSEAMGRRLGVCRRTIGGFLDGDAGRQ